MENSYLVIISVQPDFDVMNEEVVIRTIVTGKNNLKKLVTALPDKHEVIEISNLGFLVPFDEIIDQWTFGDKPDNMEFGNDQK